MGDRVEASPSKVFFVEMLTRDIDLKDAILDLLDNCVDGVLRQLGDNPKLETPYDDYWAEITASPTEFSIKDNCGGIPRDIAKDSAFRLGRTDLERDKGIATIGMYGIGMKRALFKMGKHSKVVSQHQDDAYYVEIPPKWLDEDTNWHLEMNDIDACLESDGTSITVTELHPNIARQFDKENHPFLDDLQTEISNLFTLIIKKGFSVLLNGDKIKATNLDILFPADFTQDSAIQPYAYKAKGDDMNIELAVGFYRGLASESEIGKELLTPRTRDNAGWTVICNDRVVLHRDKTEITGWGVGNVPKYHSQFIAISGIVRFLSNNSLKLPLNTTKRGLDTSSPVYWQAHKRMMEGLKKFTDFTNHWKGREDETNAYFKNMSPKDAIEVPEALPQEKWKTVRGSQGTEKRFTPELPRPRRKVDPKRRISFYRLKEEIELLGEFFFDDPKSSPAEIGDRCFEDALEKAKE